MIIPGIAAEAALRTTCFGMHTKQRVSFWLNPSHMVIRKTSAREHQYKAPKKGLVNI